jgi:hypothetical protein
LTHNDELQLTDNKEAEDRRGVSVHTTGMQVCCVVKEPIYTCKFTRRSYARSAPALPPGTLKIHREGLGRTVRQFDYARGCVLRRVRSHKKQVCRSAGLDSAQV